MIIHPPTTTNKISSDFGWRVVGGKTDLHTGVDYPAPEGDPVYSVLPGTVQGTWESGRLNLYGNVVVIRHSRGLFSLYGHLQEILCYKGQTVKPGTVIGRVGRTGGTREDPGHLIAHAHLHFEFLSKWPPAGKDLDRLNPNEVFLILQHPELMEADTAAAIAAAFPGPRRRGSSSGPLAAVAAFLIARSARGQKKSAG
jgi:murein DD-endopeptidase MepM/ murein hydrolase activator NlpD